MKVNVFISVDTEHSIGGAFRHPGLRPVGNLSRIYCMIGSKYYGIPLIMEIAETYGIRISFFLEVFNKHYFGKNETKEVAQYIVDRGHDVQLHIHPAFLSFSSAEPHRNPSSDLMAHYDLQKQLALVQEGKSILLEYGVPEPVAFRSGGFAANLDTLKALKASGFFVDSSFNAAYLDKKCLLPWLGINDLSTIEGIFELPITNFLEFNGIYRNRMKPLDINGVSFAEMRSVLTQAKSKGPRNISIILHSFSFVKAYDVQYTRVRPRFNVIRRFENLCRYLSEHHEYFDILTYDSLNSNGLASMVTESIHFYPKVPVAFSLARSLQQIRDRLT